MNPTITELITTLTTSVEVILSPSASQADRLKASQICDEFKEHSPYCIQCGLILARREYSSIVRHFGLQLLEHAIKFQWMKLSQEAKDSLKQNCLLLISEGTADILEEQPHIKDVVSRLVVEVMKHEWPNYWTTLMADMYQLCLVGPTQTELVMKVFLRLVEDIVILQTFRHQRRSEVMMALTANMGEIMELFINILRDNKLKAESLAGCDSVSDRVQAQRHVKVCAATLMTLSGYLDWVGMSHILINNSLLLELLCLLLSNTDLQLLAAECLLILVSRKGKVEERKPLLMMFHEGAMSTIWNAAVAAEKASRDDHFYLFLKKLCEILVELGKQLCVLWGSDTSPDVGQPPNFATYLEALVTFTQHPSQMLSSLTQQLWSQFLRHDQVAKDPVFVSFLPRIMETATKTLVKVGFPSQNNSLSCDYARMDFDNDEEFTAFFSIYRSKTSGTLRQVTTLIPKVAYGCASQWVKSVLAKPVNTGDGDEKADHCNFSSPSFLEWDALTVFLESVMAMLDLEDESHLDIRQDGIGLLNAVLVYDTQDPLLLSCLLSCISSLFIFLKYTPETLPAVLQKIFSAVVFNLPGQTKATRSRAVKNVRQHACSGLVKMCKQYKDLVFPVFDQLYNHVQTISSDPEQLSQMEKCILVEALILISNEFNNFQKQSSFLDEVMKPVKQLWLSEEFSRAFSGADQFMSYVGLDQAPVEPSSADTCGINRSHITYCIHMMVAVLKRSRTPADKEKAAVGGFAVSGASGDYEVVHPATSHVIILLNNLLALFRTLILLWRQESLARRHPEFRDSYELSETEKLVLLGIPHPCVDNSGSSNFKKPLERMKNFITTTHDVSCHILANACNLGDGFYSQPNLAASLISSVLTDLDLLPDYRLRPIIRVLLKSFVQNCPSKYHSTVILPVLAHICPYMYKTLEAKWQMINQRCQARPEGSEEEERETQEVIEEQLVRQVSRDYLDLMGAICSNKHSESATMEEKDSDCIEMGPFCRELGDLGACCLGTESVCEPLVMCLFNGLLWHDTSASSKCASLCFGVLRQLLANQSLSSEAAHHFYCLILSALQLHGQHESSQAILLSLGSLTYQLLRPHFPALRNLMLQIPKCTEAKLNLFEEKLFPKGPQGIGDKKKKESYKKLVTEIIGKSVGQQFKREVQYKCLPNLFKRVRPKQPALDDVEHKDIGLTDLFKPEPNGHT